MTLKILGCLGITMIVTGVGWRARMRDEIEERIVESGAQGWTEMSESVYKEAYKAGREFGIVSIIFSIFLHAVMALLCTLGNMSVKSANNILYMTWFLLLFTLIFYIKRGGSYLYKELWIIVTCCLVSTILSIVLH